MKKKICFLLDDKNTWLHEYVSSWEFMDNRFDYSITTQEKHAMNVDVVFILGFTRILSQEFLKSNGINLVVHESALPKGRGFSPVQWQIISGINQITVSLIEAVKKLDSGDIYFQTTLSLNGTELYEEIRQKQADATFQLIKMFIGSYPHFNPRKQHGVSSYFPRRLPANSEISAESTIKESFNILRVCNNDEWPAFFYLNGVKYILKIEKDLRDYEEKNR